MKNIIVGNKTIATHCLDWLVANGEAPVYIFGHPDHDASLSWQKSLRTAADKHGIPFSDVSINRQLDLVKSLDPDLILSMQYRPILKREILEIPRHGAVNLHFGLLPKYGGVSPVYNAIRNGETIIGATLHCMDSGIDTGDIIDQTEINMDNDDTAQEVFDNLTNAAYQLFRKNYFNLDIGIKSAYKQDKKRELYYKASSCNYDEERIINWRESRNAIHNRMRAYTFDRRQWSPATYIDHQLVNIKGSKIMDAGSIISHYGEIVQLDANGAYITCSDGLIRITSMGNQSAMEYCNDNNISVGKILSS